MSFKNWKVSYYRNSEYVKFAPSGYVPYHHVVISASTQEEAQAVASTRGRLIYAITKARKESYPSNFLILATGQQTPRRPKAKSLKADSTPQTSDAVVEAAQEPSPSAIVFTSWDDDKTWESQVSSNESPDETVFVPSEGNEQTSQGESDTPGKPDAEAFLGALLFVEGTFADSTAAEPESVCGCDDCREARSQSEVPDLGDRGIETPTRFRLFDLAIFLILILVDGWLVNWIYSDIHQFGLLASGPVHAARTFLEIGALTLLLIPTVYSALSFRTDAE